MTTTGIAILAFIILACIAFIFYTEWKARKDHEADMRKQDDNEREEDHGPSGLARLSGRGGALYKRKRRSP